MTAFGEAKSEFSHRTEGHPERIGRLSGSFGVWHAHLAAAAVDVSVASADRPPLAPPTAPTRK